VTAPPRGLGLGELPQIGPAVITLGVFDGVHLGHRAILEATRTAAAERGARSVALVLDPPPDELLLRPGGAVPRLAPLDVNLSRIEALDIDLAVPIQFDEPLREMTAEAFLEALAQRIELRGVTMARHSAFGRDRGGTVEQMQAIGAEHRFAVVVVDPVEVAGEIVSSSRIRAAIAAGDLATALRLGVTPYLRGTVVTGDRRGRQLGFPTANLRFDVAPAMPALGVYAGRVAPGVRGVSDRHPALISVGTRPTFHDGGEVVAEVHLLDWDGDLYGAQLGVDLVAKLRDERRFNGVDALVEQMRLDAEMGRSVLGMTRSEAP
jgi:riboflavin kinase/FMN adenylyltransferase